MAIKLDINRTMYNADETPVLKEGGAHWTLADALRNVYSMTTEKDTGETKSKKGRLLKQLNSAIRKHVPFEMSSKDADFTVECAAIASPTVVYVQIDDLINERATIGDDEESEAAAVAGLGESNA